MSASANEPARTFWQAVFLGFKLGVYGLLALNIGLFLLHGTLTEAVDSLGWLVLLAVFEWESTARDRLRRPGWEATGLLGARALGYGIVLFAAIGYLREGEWLDLANAALWLLVCAVLAWDVHVPGRYDAREWRLRNILKAVLYAPLFGIALAWGVTGAWLDFYDAALWILCFFAVELKVFRREAPAVTAA